MEKIGAEDGGSSEKDSAGAQNLETGEGATLKSLPEVNLEVKSDVENSVSVSKYTQEEKGKGKLSDISFSSALRKIKERNLEMLPEERISWKPVRSLGSEIPQKEISSLFDLSVKVLRKNAENIKYLDAVPYSMRKIITRSICLLYGSLSTHVLDLVVRGSPEEIYVQDCSRISEEDFINTFKDSDLSNLKVLQLDECRLSSDTLVKILAHPPRHLPFLCILSLSGALHLSDTGLQAIIAASPSLLSLHLSLTLITHASINRVAHSLGSLRELYLNRCDRMNVMMILQSLKSMKNLQVLSVSENNCVCDEFVIAITYAIGHNLLKLDFSCCVDLTDACLEAIGKSCPGLRSLDISLLKRLTDEGLLFLADGCREIEYLKLCHTNFSDEAIAAFLETSGGCLKELSLSGVSAIGPSTALSLARCSRMVSLDLSWCHGFTDKSLGWIVDNCSSLKLLILQLCKNITEVFLNGHSNKSLRIIPPTQVYWQFEVRDVSLQYSSMPDWTSAKLKK